MELVIVLQIGTIAGIVVLGLLAKSYLHSYIQEKTQNHATKEDIDAITRELESIKANFSKELESIKANFPKQPELLAPSPIEEEVLASPTVVGQFMRARQTVEWAFYKSNWTNAFGLGVSGGGSRACCSAWGVLNGLGAAGLYKFTTWAFMASNSGGGWTLQPLLYQANGTNPHTIGSTYSIKKMLGVHIQPDYLLPSDLTFDITTEKYLCGYGTTQMTLVSGVKWWGDLDKYFSEPRALGQNSSLFHPAAWQVCTFGASDSAVEAETGIKHISQSPYFKTNARTVTEGSPIPIAVGCIDKRYVISTSPLTYYIYPCEFTPSCSGVFRDENAPPVRKTFGITHYPDYLISNVLFGSDSWAKNQQGMLQHQIRGTMPSLTTFPGGPPFKNPNASSFGVNELMSISSNAGGVESIPAQVEAYHMGTATHPLEKGKPSIVPWELTHINDYNFVDGGVVDNIGLIPLLQRRLPKITVAICNATDYHFENPPKFDDPNIGDVTRYFGVPLDPIHQNSIAKCHIPDAMKVIASVFPRGELDELWKRLAFNFKTYGTAVATMRHTLSPSQAAQDYYGLAGPLYENYTPDVTWYVVQRPLAASRSTPTLLNAPFFRQLSSHVHYIYHDLIQNSKVNFPYYSTFSKLTLNSTEANALKYFTASMADTYLVPHVQKQQSPYHVWVDDVSTPKKFATKPYFSLLNPAVGWNELPLSYQSSDCLCVEYSPLLDRLLLLFSDRIVLHKPGKTDTTLDFSNDHVSLTSVLHTPAGLVVGGKTTTDYPAPGPDKPYLQLFYLTKTENPTSGIITYDVSKTQNVEILPNPAASVDISRKATLLRSIAGFFSERPVVNPHGAPTPVPQLSVLASCTKLALPLLWNMTIRPGASGAPPAVTVVAADNASSSATRQAATKMTLLDATTEIIWFKDAQGTATDAVLSFPGVGQPCQPIQMTGVTRIWDVTYCPIMSSLLIFHADNTGKLKVQVSSRCEDYSGTPGGKSKNTVLLCHNETGTIPLSWESTNSLSAVYQGNTFIITVREGTVLTQYQLVDQTTSELIFHKFASGLGPTFNPSYIY